MCDVLPAAAQDVRVEGSAVARARQFLDGRSCPVHGFLRYDAAQLVVSELVTNGIRHGTPPIVLTVECRAHAGTLLSVADADPTGIDDSVSPVNPRADSGRGMTIVDQLSRDWGIRARADGKEVWALV